MVTKVAPLISYTELSLYDETNSNEISTSVCLKDALTPSYGFKQSMLWILGAAAAEKKEGCCRDLTCRWR